MSKVVTDNFKGIEQLRKPIEFSDKQIKILDFLSDIDPMAAEAYKGTLESLGDIDRADRLAQTAHSMREIIALMFPLKTKANRTEKLQTIEVELTKINKDSDLSEAAEAVLSSIEGVKGARLRSIIEGLRQISATTSIPEEAIIAKARVYNESFGELSKIAHHTMEDVDEDKVERKLEDTLISLEDYLYAISTPFYETATELESLMATKNPDSRDVERLASLLQKSANYQYFFTNCVNPTWTQHLLEMGYLMTPPHKVEEEETYYYPIWYEGEYLLNTAKENAEEVVAIVLKMEGTNNVGVHRTLLEICKNLPSNKSSKLLKRIKKERWFAVKHHSRIPEVIGELIVKWLNDGFIKESSKLLDLTTFIDVETETYLDYPHTSLSTGIDSWEYNELLKTVYPEFMRQAPQEYAKILCNTLQYSIKKKLRDSKEDLLHIARPRIAGNKFVGETRNPQQILISGLQNGIDYCVDENLNEELLQIMQTLDKFHYPIFKRLQMYAISRAPELLKGNLENLIKEKTYLEQQNYWADYFDAIKAGFSYISKDAKDRFFVFLSEGPKDVEDKSKWQKLVLKSIESILPNEWQTTLKELDSRFPSLVAYKEREIGAVRTGPNSPIKEEELRKFSKTKTLQYLEDWKQPEDSFFGPSIEGLGRTLKEVVKTEPSKGIYILEKGLKTKVNPNYIYHCIAGLRESDIKDWDLLLTMFGQILNSKEPYTVENMEDEIWKSIRRSIADVLEEQLKHKKIAIKHRGRVWKILEKLARDPDPTIEHEAEYGGTNMDAGTLAINSIRGEALHGIFKYNLWINKKEDLEKRLLPEVRKLLEIKLDPKTDFSETTRAVIGQNFPYLLYVDKEWTKENIENIFGKDFQTKPAQASWDSYLKYSNFWPTAALEIKDKYIQALHSKLIDQEKSDYRISEHVLILYLNGYIDIKDDLLLEFYKHANIDARAHASWVVWKYMQEVATKKDTAEWQRIKDLWVYRLDSNTDKEPSKEIGAFTEILEKAPENIDSLIPLIKRTIPHIQRGIDLRYCIEYLEKNLAINAHMVGQALYDVVRQYPDDIRFGVHTNNIKSILQGCIDAGGEAKDYARKIIVYFGENSNHTYRDLYDQNFGKRK